MSNLQDIKTVLKSHKNIFEKYGISLVGIFGSYVRGDYNENSDVDILITKQHEQSTSLFDLMDLEDELNELLNVKVDLAIKESLKPLIGKHILKEVISV